MLTFEVFCVAADSATGAMTPLGWPQLARTAATSKGASVRTVRAAITFRFPHWNASTLRWPGFGEVLSQKRRECYVQFALHAL